MCTQPVTEVDFPPRILGHLVLTDRRLVWHSPLLLSRSVAKDRSHTALNLTKLARDSVEVGHLLNRCPVLATTTIPGLVYTMFEPSLTKSKRMEFST